MFIFSSQVQYNLSAFITLEVELNCEILTSISHKNINCLNQRILAFALFIECANLHLFEAFGLCSDICFRCSGAKSRVSSNVFVLT